MKQKLNRIYRIARWESNRTTPDLTVRNVLLAVVGIILLGTVLSLTVSSAGSISQGLYTVGVSESSPYHDALAPNDKFHLVEPDYDKFQNGEIDILLSEGTAYVSDSERGRAAAAEFRSTVLNYNDRQMRSEKNQHAAFPVKVTVRYFDLGTGEISKSPGGEQAQKAEQSSEDSNGLLDAVKRWLIQNVGFLLLPILAVYELVKSMAFGTIPQSVTPDNVSAPFPYQSLVLALVFLAPLNFIAQAYGSTFLNERLNRRGELLLASPSTASEIILGKTLPYVMTMFVMALLLGLGTGAGLIGALAVIPFVIAFLGGVFLASMFARSYKELTFVTVTISVLIISFGFIPSMFTNVHPIAIISPLTIVVEQLEGTQVKLVEFLFSTVPLTLVGLTAFLLGAAIYREEDMFTQKPLRGKAIDSLANWCTSLKRVPLITAALLPAVFALELAVLPVVFPLPPSISIPVLLLAIAIIEELGKTLHIYAGFQRGRFDSTLKNALLSGVLSGVAFFIAEKVTAVVQIVGLNQLDVGQAAFGMSAAPATPFPTWILYLAPLALHIAAPTVAALGGSRGRYGYIAGLIGAILIHGVYDLFVVMMYV